MAGNRLDGVGWGIFFHLDVRLMTCDKKMQYCVSGGKTLFTFSKNNLTCGFENNF